MVALLTLLLALAFQITDSHKYGTARKTGVESPGIHAKPRGRGLSERFSQLLASFLELSAFETVEKSVEPQPAVAAPFAAPLENEEPVRPTQAMLAMQRQQISAHAGKSGEPPEQLEAYEDHGLFQPSRVTPEQMEMLTSQITTETYGKMLHRAVDGRATRFADTNGNREEELDLMQMMKDYELDVSTNQLVATPTLMQFMSHKLNSNDVGSIVGRLEGRHPEMKKETIILGAHFDSVNWEKPGAAAPGVDDNGSGIALVLLAAKVLSLHPELLDRSVVFVLFNAEEEGTIGSEEFVPLAKSGKYGDVKAALIVDEVAFPGSGTHKDKAIFETHWKVGDRAKWLVDTLANSAKPGDGIEGFAVNYNGFGSDHMSFLDQGIPSILLIERDNMAHADEYGHSSRDTFEHVDLAYGAAMARLALRALVDMASPQQP